MVYPHDRRDGCIGIDIHIGVKFGVARFDIIGQFSGALGSEASDGWASRFYLYAFCISFCNFDAVAPSGLKL